MAGQEIDRGQLSRLALSRVALMVLVLAALFFGTAGTLAYWEAWVYLLILTAPVLLVGSYLFRHDPELLVRRLRMREREPQQRRIIALSVVWFLATYGLPGLDHRWSWSHVSWPVVALADLLVLAGYGVFVWVLRENRYLARTVAVDAGQTVIATGPYALVRHPMYVGVALMYLASPVALGSWWALLPAVAIVPLLVARISNEEAVLLRELAGYDAYRQQVRWRLLPGVW